MEKTKHILKNGEELIVRGARIEDAAELVAVVKEYVEESEFIPYEKDEFSLSVEDEQKWIQSFLDRPNSLLLLAEINGHIVGNISVNGIERKMMSHTACIGIGMLKEYRGTGIGSALVDMVVKWAKANPLLEILWLETYDSNVQGHKLYIKYGFEEVGRHPNFVKIGNDKYVANITMTLNVK
ncbi:GNAT family N-acetyltransferase [Dysgonomonas macrotermitis]|uniref:Protein N-acetyltransferase, RimJ/RimL family n=1 Tax=Dysgonomonas macrotermitis TaxID=1346286 RepID=A0A1M5EII0_9BACT|nr:GNAT family N-acetyltransferase [Dysgonomonas macrotermitis]SHF79093.1 Protein N-acetyltransferase, RimJ/RimL family [Dysgonomonas macrotermitis]